MNKHERLTEILDYLKSHKELSVEEACTIFNSSAATIRRDFSYLFDRKKVEKIWGGNLLRVLDAVEKHATALKSDSTQTDKSRHSMSH